MLRILLVEHDVNDLELIQYELNKSGFAYTLSIVSSQTEFAIAIMQNYPDIILSDLSLPDFDGMRAFDIRQKIAPNIPFIFVSGDIMDEQTLHLLNEGLIDYVNKDKLHLLNPKIHDALIKAGILNFVNN